MYESKFGIPRDAAGFSVRAGSTTRVALHGTARRAAARRGMAAAAAGGREGGRGAFVLFEGPDRSGKTTQARRLVEALAAGGRDTVFMNFPDRKTEVGKMINAYLKQQVETDDRAIHLLFSANRWEQRDKIVATLEAGTNIVMDRYSFSGAAFSTAKGLDADWCFAPERGLPAPDAVLYLDLSPEEAQKRGDYGEERYEKVELQRRVGDAFRALRERHSRPDSEWIVIPAAQTPDELHKDVLAAATRTIAAAAGRPLAVL